MGTRCVAAGLTVQAGVELSGANSEWGGIRAGRYLGGLGRVLSRLLYSAIEAAVVSPLARNVMPGHRAITAPPAPWTAEFSIGMVAAAGVVVWVLYSIVGRPLRRQVYTPGLTKRERRDLGLRSYARIGWAVPITAGMALAAGALIVGVIGLWWHYPRLDGRLMPDAYAPLLALFGVVIVGRARGTGMGLSFRATTRTAAMTPAWARPCGLACTRSPPTGQLTFR